MTHPEVKTLGEIIGTREHPGLAAKHDIWRLVHQSYKGGIEYIKGGNLFQYRIEDKLRYDQRQQRADFTNHVQQIIDMLIGFIDAKPVERVIDKKFKYVIENISKGKTLAAFMHSLSFNCLKSTCGVLIDSPRFDNPNLSEAERKMSGINPYAVYYSYTNICDFEIGDDGKLLWVILDNSYIDKTDPLKEPEKICLKRLWTREFFQDAKKIKLESSKEEKWELQKEVNHNTGLVPFVFCNSRDIEDDFICDSPFEDIALKSRKIFNIASWCDETLAGSSFQILFFPYKNETDIKNITKMFNPDQGGISDIPVVPFNGELSQKPYFDGAKIDNIDKYIALINHYSDEILAKFGMKTDSKGSWESGVAKSIDFDKTESYLRGVTHQLEKTEIEIAEICGRWENKDAVLQCKYPENFEADDIDKELNRLAQVFTIPSKTLQQKAHKAMVTKIFPDIEQSELDVIIKEIDSDENPPSDNGNGDEDKNSGGTLKTANKSE